ncbi:MAG: cupin domain-containing protein, partial [Chitinophagaceae bacterium]|nr:cupin domain-containing protein [Chitinophagaceae bacterium]
QQNKNAKEAENTLLVNNQKADSSAKVQNDLLKEQSKIDAPAPKLEIINQQPAKTALNPNDNIAKDNVYGKVRLFYDSLSASFLLTIPTETKMHFHESHSEHILLIEGEGMALIGYKTHTLKKNDLIFIPKGTPHKIINTGKNPIKILSIQAPFFDWSDHNIIE